MLAEQDEVKFKRTTSEYLIKYAHDLSQCIWMVPEPIKQEWKRINDRLIRSQSLQKYDDNVMPKNQLGR